jgi:RecJ-like exonuclease
MSRKFLIAIAVLVAAMFIGASLMAADPEKPAKPAAKPDTTATKAAVKFEYIGKDKCKLCHMKDEYGSWLTTAHAKAWEALKPEEQKKDSCTVCHSTGKDAAGTLLTGVQCEACHGPGSAYRTQANMKNKKLALGAGMTEPTKEVCVKCHNDKSPNFKGFDFDKYSKDLKGMHKIFPKKTEEKKG